MPIESATYVSQLVVSNPTGGDPRNTTDDHLRLIKAVLQNTFPSLSGAVNASQSDLNKLYNTTATSADINLLAGIAAAGNVLAHFPSGTKLPFYQPTPPAGWNVVTVQNDSMMRVVSSGSTGGTSGAGSGHSPILNNVVPSHTHNYSGSTGNNNVDHTHEYDRYDRSGITVGASINTVYAVNASTTRYSTGGQSQPHHHDYSGTTDGGSSNTNWQPRYMDFCIGSKV